MSDVDFKPLFGYLDEKFQAQDQRFDRIENRLDHIETSVDNLAKMVKDFRDEHIVLHHRLEVLENWARQVAAKLGIELPT